VYLIFSSCDLYSTLSDLLLFVLTLSSSSNQRMHAPYIDINTNKTVYCSRHLYAQTYRSTSYGISTAVDCSPHTQQRPTYRRVSYILYIFVNRRFSFKQPDVRRTHFQYFLSRLCVYDLVFDCSRVHFGKRIDC